MADPVGVELDFVGVFGEARRVGHDAGVVHEDVKAVVLSHKGRCSRFDGSKGGKVEFQVSNEIYGVERHSYIVFGLRGSAEVNP